MPIKRTSLFPAKRLFQSMLKYNFSSDPTILPFWEALIDEFHGQKAVDPKYFVEKTTELMHEHIKDENTFNYFVSNFLIVFK